MYYFKDQSKVIQLQPPPRRTPKVRKFVSQNLPQFSVPKNTSKNVPGASNKPAPPKNFRETFKISRKKTSNNSNSQLHQRTRAKCPFPFGHTDQIGNKHESTKAWYQTNTPSSRTYSLASTSNRSFENLRLEEDYPWRVSKSPNSATLEDIAFKNHPSIFSTKQSQNRSSQEDFGGPQINPDFLKGRPSKASSSSSNERKRDFALQECNVNKATFNGPFPFTAGRILTQREDQQIIKDSEGYIRPPIHPYLESPGKTHRLAEGVQDTRSRDVSSWYEDFSWSEKQVQNAQDQQMAWEQRRARRTDRRRQLHHSTRGQFSNHVYDPHYQTGYLGNEHYNYLPIAKGMNYGGGHSRRDGCGWGDDSSFSSGQSEITDLHRHSPWTTANQAKQGCPTSNQDFWRDRHGKSFYGNCKQVCTTKAERLGKDEFVQSHERESYRKRVVQQDHRWPRLEQLQQQTYEEIYEDLLRDEYGSNNYTTSSYGAYWLSWHDQNKYSLSPYSPGRRENHLSCCRHWECSARRCGPNCHICIHCNYPSYFCPHEMVSQYAQARSLGGCNTHTQACCPATHCCQDVAPHHSHLTLERDSFRSNEAVFPGMAYTGNRGMLQNRDREIRRQRCGCSTFEWGFEECMGQCQNNSQQQSKSQQQQQQLNPGEQQQQHSHRGEIEHKPHQHQQLHQQQQHINPEQQPQQDRHGGESVHEQHQQHHHHQQQQQHQQTEVQEKGDSVCVTKKPKTRKESITEICKFFEMIFDHINGAVVHCGKGKTLHFDSDMRPVILERNDRSYFLGVMDSCIENACIVYTSIGEPVGVYCSAGLRYFNLIALQMGKDLVEVYDEDGRFTGLYDNKKTNISLHQTRLSHKEEILQMERGILNQKGEHKFKEKGERQQQFVEHQQQRQVSMKQAHGEDGGLRTQEQNLKSLTTDQSQPDNQEKGCQKTASTSPMTKEDPISRVRKFFEMCFDHISHAVVHCTGDMILHLDGQMHPVILETKNNSYFLGRINSPIQDSCIAYTSKEEPVGVLCSSGLLFFDLEELRRNEDFVNIFDENEKFSGIYDSQGAKVYLYKTLSKMT